ncbi:MAG TPA: hypothetical protein VJV78_05150 [Polyangiales bacterium]|nr:hypothetical protein [Polyangiales bacterium]
MRSLWSRFLVGLAAAAFAALPAQPLVGTSYLCHMTGEVSGTHCCAGKRAESCHAQIERADCCEVMPSHGQPTAPATRSSSQDAPVLALIAAPAVVVVARAPAQWIRPAEPADARPPGPPRFLANCSFLI